MPTVLDSIAQLMAKRKSQSLIPGLPAIPQSNFPSGGYWNDPSMVKAPVGPSYPQTATALNGNFWNSPSMVKPPVAAAPIQPQVNNQVQAFTPPPQRDALGEALLKMLGGTQTHHYGIGGAEISEANPYGNPGGDPFKNGFFKQTPTTPGMMFLSGTPRPDATQMAMVQAANQQRTMTPPIGVPGGDPNARAFWGQMGLGRKNGYLPF